MRRGRPTTYLRFDIRSADQVMTIEEIEEVEHLFATWVVRALQKEQERHGVMSSTPGPATAQAHNPSCL